MIICICLVNYIIHTHANPFPPLKKNKQTPATPFFSLLSQLFDKEVVLLVTILTKLTTIDLVIGLIIKTAGMCCPIYTQTDVFQANKTVQMKRVTRLSGIYKYCISPPPWRRDVGVVIHLTFLYSVQIDARLTPPLFADGRGGVGGARQCWAHVWRALMHSRLSATRFSGAPAPSCSHCALFTFTARF